MSQSMNPGGNPVTGSGSVAGRSQRPNARNLRAFRGGEAIEAQMAAPTVRDKHCVFVGRDERVEFIVRTAKDVTAYTIHYGRWVEGPPHGGENTELDGWLELGTIAVTGASEGKLVQVPPFEAFTDAVGVYVDTLTGTPAEGNGFRFWYRGIP